jgi:hypothetical protein
MADTQVRLIKSKVIHGSVWLAGSLMMVAPAIAKRWEADGEAEIVKPAPVATETAAKAATKGQKPAASDQSPVSSNQ